MATHIKTIINKFLKEEGIKKNNKEKIKKIISKNLNKNLAEKINSLKIYQNKLILSCSLPSYGFEFNLKKNKILKEVKKEFPQIENVKIKINN